MKFQFVVLALLLSANAIAGNNHPSFPAAATQFIDSEMPAMEVAVAAKDRTYFSGATDRMNAFLKEWNAFAPGNSLLEKYPACSAAVTDFVIVGLCKISPPDTICEPKTFIPEFEKNRADCRVDSRR